MKLEEKAEDEVWRKPRRKQEGIQNLKDAVDACSSLDQRASAPAEREETGAEGSKKYKSSRLKKRDQLSERTFSFG